MGTVVHLRTEAIVASTGRHTVPPRTVRQWAGPSNPGQDVTQYQMVVDGKVP